VGAEEWWYFVELDAIRVKMGAILRDFDAILSPIAALPAIPHGASIDDQVFPGFSYTMPYNLTGVAGARSPRG